MGGASRSAYSVVDTPGKGASISLEPSVVTLVVKEARAQKKSASKLVNEALAAYLEELADYRAVKAALRRKEKPIAWSDARKHLGLDR